MRWMLVVAMLVLAAGCASFPQAGTVEAGSASKPASSGTGPAAPSPGAPAEAPSATTRPYPGAAEPAPAPSYHPAGQALISQAREQSRGGDMAAAGSTLERALRVDPDNPWIWIELARVRYAEGDPGGAQGMARKALSLAGPDEEAARIARGLVSGAGP